MNMLNLIGRDSLCNRFNYRMPALNAALGVAQMEQMDKFVKVKRDLASRYMEAFKDIEGVKIFKEPEYAQSNYFK